MYVYLYDELVKNKKYKQEMRSIENRLTDFGIAGRIVRLQQFTNSEAVISEEMKRGAEVAVIVGNDNTFGQVLSRSASLDIVFGFIPMGSAKDNTIAQVLGIPMGEEACDVLARRRKVGLDVGWVNNRYFISQLHIKPHAIRVQYDEQFAVSARNGKMELVVCNLQPFIWNDTGKQQFVVHPQDGKLEAFLRPMKKKTLFREVYEEPSVFPFEEMVVQSDKPFLMEADGKKSKETKVTIRLARNRIHMIVGKNRKF